MQRLHWTILFYYNLSGVNLYTDKNKIMTLLIRVLIH